MAEVVDSIVAELIVRGVEKYEQNFDRLIAKNTKFTRSVADLQKLGLSPPPGYADGTAKAVNAGTIAHEQAAVRIKRARKSQADDSIAQDTRTTASAKRAAKEQADAAIAESRRVAAENRRFAALAERASTAGRVVPGSGRNLGIVTRNEPSGQRGIPAAALAGGATADVAAAKEVNHLLADQARLQAALTTAKGAERTIIRDELANIRLIRQLERAGLGDAEIALAVERRTLAVEAERAALAAKQGRLNASRSAGQFASGAGIGAGTGAAIGGIAAAAGVSALVRLTKEGLEYALSLKVVSEQLGITTRDLQVYETAAGNVGVSQEQLRTSFGQLAANLGRAQEGAEQQGKIFRGLGVDIGTAKTGYKTLSDILPTIIERLSSIENPAQRAAIETALFGEQGRRLDSVLSGGIDQVNNLADGLERTGGILSDAKIQQAAKVAQDLERLGDQLQRQLAGVVADNAAAINQLATSFFNAASRGLQLLSVLQRFGALKVSQSLPASDPRSEQGRALLNGTGEGRQAALQANSNALKALRTIKRDGTGPGIGSFYIPGVGDVANNPAGMEAAKQELFRQRRATLRAAAQANAQLAPVPVQGGSTGDLGSIFAPNPRHRSGGSTGKSAETLAREAEQRAKRFASQLAGYQDDELRAQQSLTADIAKRAAIEKELADRTLKHELEEIESQRKINVLAGGNIGEEADRADQLRKAAEAAYARDIQNIELDKQLELARAATDKAEAALSADADRLQIQLSLARTADERREIELRLLAIAKEEERARLQGIINASKPGDPAADLARSQLGTIDARFADQARQAKDRNRGPLEDYRRSLDDPRTQVEQAVADKLRAVDEAITDAAANVLGVKDPFLKQLLQIFLEQNVLKPLYDALQNAQGGGGGGFFGSVLSFGASLFGGGSGGDAGLFNSATNAANSVFGGSIPKFAGGGSMRVGGRPGVDRNLLSINGEPRALVGAHETLSVNPDVAASNRSVNQPRASTIVVVQPIHADFSGARTDEQTMRQFTDYADARSRQAYEAAVKTSGGQVAGIVQRKQTLG